MAKAKKNHVQVQTIEDLEKQIEDLKVQLAAKPIAGLRGLKAMVFGEFAKADDLQHLPTMAEVTEMVKQNFPQSAWLTSAEKAKIHYSYYKSKFISALQTADMVQQVKAQK